MNFTARDAIVHITRAFGVPLTDDEVSTLVAESTDAIEAHGMAVREAAKKYEEFVISLAADMVARRTPDPELEVPMRNESSQRGN